MNILVLSALPHYAAIYPMKDNLQYIFIVSAGTTVSILYHLNPDLLWLMLMDYMVSGLWFLTDMTLSARDRHVFSRVFFLNIFVFGAWIVFPADMHSSWHLISAMKCYCVATLLRDIKPIHRIHPKWTSQMPVPRLLF